jgi:hypothetical protein
MNERIRELAEQAGIETEFDDYGEVRISMAFRSALEKFAELLIKDCANIVNSLEQHEGQGDCYTVEYLKERFGVE